MDASNAFVLDLALSLPLVQQTGAVSPFQVFKQLFAPRLGCCLTISVFEATTLPKMNARFRRTMGHPKGGLSLDIFECHGLMND